MIQYTPTLSSLSSHIAPQRVTSPLQVEQLVDDKQIIRILQPELLQRLSERNENGHLTGPFITFHGQLFLSLQKIRNAEERERVFYLLRDYQLGNKINMSMLPRSIRAALTGQPTKSELNTKNMLLGLLGGALVGVFSLVLCLFISTISGSTLVSGNGMQIAMIAFSVGTLLGSIGTSFLLWQRQ